MFFASHCLIAYVIIVPFLVPRHPSNLRTQRCHWVPFHRVLMLPMSRCVGFPSVLSQCCNPSDLVLLLFSLYLLSLCVIVVENAWGFWLTLDAKHDELGVDYRTINSPMPFCDPMHDATLIAHSRSPRMRWFESMLLQNLLSWCCFHGFSLRRDLKKRPREKVSTILFKQKALVQSCANNY